MKIRVTHKTDFFGVITFLMLCCIAKAYNTTVTQRPGPLKIPCFFVFGDSLVDHGNSNELLTVVKSNYWPYGIDFPGGATGRFTNGRTIIDELANYLGITNFIPPSLKATDADFMRGVNFAAGAAGIRDETGNYLGINIPMNEQTKNFAKVVERMREHFKRDEKALQNHLRKCIVYSGMGSNDYLNNYFMPWLYPTSKKFTPEEFAQALIRDYTRQLTDLYTLGVRKMIVPGIGPMGCIPLKRKEIGTNESTCNEDENNAVQHFNRALRKLVDTVNHGQLPGAKFVYLDHYGGCMDLVSNRPFYGLEVVDKGCCGVGKKNSNGGEITCFPWQTPCDDRGKYLFWDAFHPSEMVHKALAKMAYTSKPYSRPPHAYPINVMQLAML